VSPVELCGLDGIRLAADARGDPNDPTVVLLHGGGQTRHAWGGALGVLAAHGWYALAVDLRGHGDSEWSPDGVYDLDRFAADTAEIARAFDRPALVGASLGGLASLAAIGEADDPIASALVLVDVTPRLEMPGVRRIGEFMRSGLDGFDSLEQVADAVAGYVTHRPRPTDLSGLRKNVRQRADGKWVWHWDPRFVDRMSDAAGEPTGGFIRANRLHEAATRVGVPTLLVRGGVSDVVSVEGVEELRRLVPHAEVVDVAGVGHMVAGDRNDRFNAAIVEFLDRVARSSAP
jgi:non-heme chloroperoxidase